MKIELDEYERDNLLWLLDEVKRTHDTGDWFHQIRFKLEPERGPGRPNRPRTVTQ